jgi:hypothetical protein
MKKLTCVAGVLFLLAPAWAQPPQIDDKRFQEIRAKRQRGEKITEEERDYGETKIERQNQEQSAQRNAEWAKAHPARESTGLVPLDEMGKATWEGYPGGLYPGGANTPPAAHLEAGLRLARAIGGRIAMCTIGMSNTTQESRSFLKLAAGDPEINPQLTVVDCAQGAQTASKIKDPKLPYWNLVKERLSNAGVTPQQVQVVWVKEANPSPTGSAVAYAKQLHDDQVEVLHNLHDKFPNLKIAYLSQRIYGGWAVGGLNPEPYAYSGSFAVKWLIEDQISGKPELNYDPAKGPVRAPWIAWGPPLWADGLKARADGLVWKREDLGPDGTHPSVLGREKVARLLMAFLKSDPTARPWFRKP